MTGQLYQHFFFYLTIFFLKVYQSFNVSINYLFYSFVFQAIAVIYIISLLHGSSVITVHVSKRLCIRINPYFAQKHVTCKINVT